MHISYDEPTFGVAVEGQDGDAVVVFRGDLDLGAVVQLQDCIDRVGHPGRPLTIDLSGVTFMDSSGINILLRFWQAGGGDAEAVTLRSPSEAVVATLEMAGVAHMFRTLDAAGSADGADGADGSA